MTRGRRVPVLESMTTDRSSSNYKWWMDNNSNLFLYKWDIMPHLTAEPCMLINKQMWRIEPEMNWDWDYWKPIRTQSETSVTNTSNTRESFSTHISLIPRVTYLVSWYGDLLTVLLGWIKNISALSVNIILITLNHKIHWSGLSRCGDWKSIQSCRA